MEAGNLNWASTLRWQAATPLTQCQYTAAFTFRMKELHVKIACNFCSTSELTAREGICVVRKVETWPCD